MFCELNSLQHLIIRPPGDADPNNPLWTHLSQRVSSTFLVDSAKEREWNKALKGKRCQILNWQDDLSPAALGNVRLVLKEKSFLPCETVYVTWDGNDIDEIVNTRVGTILIEPRPNNFWPDMELKNEKELIQVIDDTLSGKPCGYAGEILVASHATNMGLGKYFYKEFREKPKTLPDKEITIYAAGRYFTSADDRYQKHLWTQHILRGVKDGVQYPILPHLMAHALATIDLSLELDLIVGVPPRPNSSKRGLNWVIERACYMADDEQKLGRGILKSLYKPEKLSCIKNYQTQKHLGSIERRENVRGAFKARGLVGGERILLVDDVLTTGATIGACIDTLLEAGAKEVFVLVLGRTIISKPTKSNKLLCNDPNCDGHYVIRFRRDNHKPLWGCSNFPEKKGRCQQTLKWEEGFQALNRLNSVEDIEEDLIYIDDIDLF